jgi:hypothetical protein
MLPEDGIGLPTYRFQVGFHQEQTNFSNCLSFPGRCSADHRVFDEPTTIDFQVPNTLGHWRSGFLTAPRLR